MLSPWIASDEAKVWRSVWDVTVCYHEATLTPSPPRFEVTRSWTATRIYFLES
jgi:hypothetical protein